MSVNITVNGEYMKSCPKHFLLCDQERLKKEAENERRKLRIQQVREASKDMAKKVRNNVELEKEKQMKKIEEIKAKEMELWRQNILEEKEANYKSAIFQIGTAHRAAQRENEKQAKMKINTKQRTPKVNRTKGPSTLKGKENTLRNANAQTVITGNIPGPSQYVKSTVCVSESPYSDSEGDTAINQNTSSCSEDTLNSSESTSSSYAELPEPTHNFSKSQTLKDRSGINQRNTQMPSVNKSPQKKFDIVSKKLARPCSETVNVPEPKSISPTKITKSLMAKRCDLVRKSASEDLASRPTDTRRRFTQISDFIRQQEADESIPNPPTIPKQSQPSTVHLQKSPNKSKSPASKRSYPMPTLKNSPSKSRSSTVLRQTFGTSTDKLCSAGTSGRVQFYDHNNRFQKQYTQPASIVHMHTGSTDALEMNAMEQASLEKKLQETREEEMERLRKKTDERCQKAIEREQVRRACEDLTAKLDALNKQRQLLPSDNHQYSSVRLSQMATEKESKLNTAVENILRRPAIITCPPVNRPTLQPSMPSAARVNELNVGSSANDINSLNSSDSCCSILLGYVNGQTKQIVDDIKKYNDQTGETGKMKVEKLQDLLNRINRLRESLLTEIAKYTNSSSSDKDLVQKLMSSISQFRKERESILVDNGADDIAKRESALKKKEAILEQKVKEFYKTQKAIEKRSAQVINMDEKTEQRRELNVAQKSKQSTEDVRQDIDNPQKQSGKEMRKEEKPQTNVDKREEETQPCIENERKKVNKPREKSQDSTLDESEDSSEEFVKRKEVIVDKKPLEIVIKVRGSTRTKKPSKLTSKSPRKLSTLIQSPVSAKSRRKVSISRSVDSNSTSYRSLPPALHTGMDDLVTKDEPIPVESKRQTSSQTSVKKKPSNLNPLMAHYIQRLLGMSRTSINALGMLSSDIDTPSSSIVNTTANLSSVETEKLASSRLENVQRFIEDNYSFINEFEESLRNSSAKESSLKTAELVWKKTLKEQKNPSKESEKKITHDSPKDPEKTSIKPAPKPSVESNTQQKQLKKQQAVQVDKCTQLTDNCTQRIAELSAMIDKIRQEKQKILETTFSSVSENGPNSTEYLDLPDRRNERSTSKSLELPLSRSSENLPTQSLGNVPQLEKNTAIGMSRDSGISESRPITVQETREGSTENLQKLQSSTESLSAFNKPPKPPISIARYSPQLVEDIPHELSTIFEVETPATSKLNTSLNGQRTDAVAQLEEDQPKEIVYKKFPTFEEYARLNQLDMSQFDPEFSVQFEREFNEFMQLAKDGKIADYEQFTSFSQYVAKSSSGGDKEAAEEFLESLKMANLSFKKFPTRKEYLSKLGISTSDMIDSQSLEYIDDSKNCYSTSTSGESLLNIESELKQRKILTKSFRQNAPAPAHPTSAPDHPEARDYRNEISGITQLTSALTSTDDQSETFEQDLQRMGINWHAAMKKKTIQTQALSSTSTSLDQETPRTKKLKGKTPETSHVKDSRERTSHTEEGGRQLNIREFLTRELLKRTTTSSSISFSDDSVASSILRSIIGSIASSPHPADPGPALERHKTSTPMASHSTLISGRVATKSRESGSSQLFSGESLLSSVHFESHTKDATKAKQKAAPSEFIK